jgi:hypothetical protein
MTFGGRKQPNEFAMVARNISAEDQVLRERGGEENRIELLLRRVAQK